ncbi:biopolymer transport protein ExbB/TolQ [Algisphaera agarilytica]|uniref:Biopolymer transport protein ExbB/TolQ n=2 Tax=Algisphaera agarilytica TaxID=1385975 RepID=A0A7X0H6M6_9BACT|nr:biopolymer transport protein ExbB/TolQ [Algisphaera agarilytica]
MISSAPSAGRAPVPARRLWPRALVMIAALLAVGSTLTLRAQNSPALPPAPTASPTQPAPAPASPGVVPATPAPVPASAPATPTDYGNLGDLSVQPIYKLRQMFEFAPVINGIIGGLSVLSLMFFLWFLFTINSRSVAPAAFVNEITNLVLVGRYDAAAEACRRSKGVFIAPIILRCVENHGKSQSIIMSMIDAEGRRLSDIIWNRISYLADISNVAPMLGLLGTVIGMITAFFGLDKESGSIDSTVLSQGVGQAMATTMFGLMVGISALVFYSIIKSRATKTLAEAEAAVHTIADRIRNAEDDEPEEEPSKLL